jgi:hypothetical protein
MLIVSSVLGLPLRETVFSILSLNKIKKKDGLIADLTIKKKATGYATGNA